MNIKNNLQVKRNKDNKCKTKLEQSHLNFLNQKNYLIFQIYQLHRQHLYHSITRWKLFIKHVDKMKYVEKLVHNYRIEIKPNSYTSLDANNKDNILQKYPYLLSFLYTSGYKNSVSHKYFINKFLNKPQKIHNENDKLWDEFLTESFL